jgi:NADH-quinone oxidoreductase subunit G/NADP-reducing hydrogenase subunit HndD
MKINGMWPVDYVLTTRELSFLMKKNKIDFANLKKSRADDPLGDYSGGGVIFGSSGGVMESALRTAQYILQTAQGLACDKKKKNECVTKIDFNEVRGLEGLKEAEINLAGKKLRVGVLNSIGNIEKVLSKLADYDYLEVMACPGGCIGGGGQPIPTTAEIRKKRMAALYQDDKKRLIRNSFENNGAQAVLKWLESKGKLAHQVLHTSYKKRLKY